MNEIECKSCGKMFLHPRKRGRPPSKCPECKENEKKAVVDSDSTKKQLDPKARVDRLELQLRAEGKHISQWRTEYD